MKYTQGDHNFEIELFNIQIKHNKKTYRLKPRLIILSGLNSDIHSNPFAPHVLEP